MKPLSSRERALSFAQSVPRPEVAKPSRAASAAVVEQLCRLQLEKKVSGRDRGGLAELIRSELAGASSP